MGAGAVRAQSPQQATQSSSSDHSQASPRSTSNAHAGRRATKNNSTTSNPSTMSCEACKANFSLFKRKKICNDCGKTFCSACLVKQPSRPSSQRRCSRCQLLSTGNFTRHDLQKLESKFLRAFLVRKGVDTVLCSEKNDLIELVLRFSNSSQHFREQRASQQHTAHLEERMRSHATEFQPTSRNASSEERSSPSRDEGSVRAEEDGEESAEERNQRLLQRQREEMAETEARLREELQTEEVDSRPRRKHASIEELKEEGDIDELTVRQLKEILATNYVDYKGCVEKWELVSRVKRLWEENAAKRQSRLDDGEDGLDANEADMCKVCMDAVIDCVLLECGHMLTCTKCGRQLSECPICRQYVTRVVHTFRA